VKVLILSLAIMLMPFVAGTAVADDDAPTCEVHTGGRTGVICNVPNVCVDTACFAGQRVCVGDNELCK
jgi:hypothetical protein